MEIPERIKKVRKVAIPVVLGLLALWIAWPHITKAVSGNKITASGTIEVTEVDLTSRVNARVIELSAAEGKAVKKGEVVAKLDDRVVQAQKKAAFAAYESARRMLNGMEDMKKQGLASAQGYEQALAAFLTTRALLEQANMMFEDTAVTAPWDGTILKKHVEIGELLAPNTPIFTLGDMTQVKVTIYVPLPDLGKIKLNQQAVVSIDSFPGKKYPGNISAISDQAEFTPKNVQTKDERVKQVFAVEITVPNPEGELKPGMPADVVIAPEKK